MRAARPEKPPRPASAPISYQLEIDVSTPVRIRVGRLGRLVFAAGRYVYTGSARRAMEARIARHLRSTKALHWHIDYLLSAPGVRVIRVLRSTRPECELNAATRGTVAAPGFGASDCRGECGSHLKRVA